MLYQVELLAYGRGSPAENPRWYPFYYYLRRILCTVRLRSDRQYFFNSSLGDPSATLISVR